MYALVHAAGFGENDNEDRWESGKAIEDLKKSRNQNFRGTPSEPEKERDAENGPGNEFLWHTSSPVFRLYRLPNSDTASKWDTVTRVIHRCAASYEIVFDEKVTNDNRADYRFWERACNHREG